MPTPVDWLYKDRAASGHNQELPFADRTDVSLSEVQMNALMK